MCICIVLCGAREREYINIERYVALTVKTTPRQFGFLIQFLLHKGYLRHVNAALIQNDTI